MDEILRLVKIVTKRGKKNIQLLDFKTIHTLPNKENQLFLLIKDGKFTNDKEAAKEIYNQNKVDYRYRMLKSRLKQKLLNHLFFLDFQNDYIKASHHDEQECLNFLHQGRMLVKFGEHKIAEKILTKAIQLAKESEFNYIILDCLKLLKVIYANTVRPVLYHKTREQVEEYKHLINKEEEAADLYHTIYVELNRSVTSRKQNLETTGENLKLMYQLWKDTNSYNIYEHYHLLNIWYLELTGQFEEVLKQIDNLEKHSREIINRKRFDNRYNKYAKIYAYLRTKNFELGLKYAEENIESFSRYSNNWFAVMENYFLLAMHSRNYGLASELLKEVGRNPNYSKISGLAKERWNLFKAYFNFINPQKDISKSFNYYEFVSTVPEFSKDKEGYNLAILVLQYLYYLESRDLDALMFRVESLKKYMSRHFKDSFSERTILFFKLIVLVVQHDFDLKTAKKKINNLLQRLQNASAPGDAYAEIEIIPYEHLWEWLVDKLTEFDQTGNRLIIS